MKNKITNKIGYVAASGILLSSILLAVPTFAETTTTLGTNVNLGVKDSEGNSNGEVRVMEGHGGMMGDRGGKKGQMPGIYGTVASVNGNTITVTSKVRPNMNPMLTTSTPANPVTYTVDVSNAAVTKNGAVSTVANVLVGDTVMIQGTVTGNNVVANLIRDGFIMKGKGGEGQKENNGGPKPASIIQGNGQPIVGGNVTAISGTTITIVNKANVSYTINAASAVVQKGDVSSTVSAISVGDSILVQGAVNGNVVTASSIVDGGSVAPNTNSEQQPQKKGFFSGIGNFFHNLFGF